MSLEHYVNAYDIAYIFTAKSRNLILVTSDSGMYINAKNVFNIEVILIDEFLKHLLNNN